MNSLSKGIKKLVNLTYLLINLDHYKIYTNDDDNGIGDNGLKYLSNSIEKLT